MAISLLLADDSPTIAKILTMALANEDYAVRSVLSADLAIAELKKSPPEIFLVDLTLPEKDGYALCHFVKNEPSMRKVRVALLASAFDPAEPEKVKSCQADAVIVKPFDPNELRSKLREMMNAPNLLPPGSHVQGSTMGHDVSINTPSQVDLATPPPMEPLEVDADSLLHSLVHNTNIDIDLAEEESLPPAPPPPPLAESLAPTPKEEPLSANAQALAEFFSAEVESYKPKADTSELAIDLTEESSYSSPAPSSLDAWSSAPSPATIAPKKSEPLPKATVASRESAGLFDVGGSNFRFSPDYTRRITRAFTGDLNEQVPSQAPKAPAKTELFPHESTDSPSWAVPNIALPEVDDSLEIAFDEPKAVKTSAPKANIAPTQAAPFSMPPPEEKVAPLPGPTNSLGNLSSEETAKIEQMIREEVHLVCREIVEKVAWEVIPELAENLIKKELQKVMEQLEQ